MIWERLPKTKYVGHVQLEIRVFDAVANFNDGSQASLEVIREISVKTVVRSIKKLVRLPTHSVRDNTKLSGYPRSNDKTRLKQSNYYLASGRFPIQNAIYDNKLPFSRM